MEPQEVVEEIHEQLLHHQEVEPRVGDHEVGVAVVEDEREPVEDVHDRELKSEEQPKEVPRLGKDQQEDPGPLHRDQSFGAGREGPGSGRTPTTTGVWGDRRVW